MNYSDYEPAGDKGLARTILEEHGLTAAQIKTALSRPRLFVDKVRRTVVTVSEEFPRIWRKATQK